MKVNKLRSLEGNKVRKIKLKLQSFPKPFTYLNIMNKLNKLNVVVKNRFTS